MYHFVALTFIVVVIAAVGLYKRHYRWAMSIRIKPLHLGESITNSRAVILRSKAGPYVVVNDWPRPRISPKELLVKVRAIGLNPIDWKCVSYGFGVHSIPWVSGREAAGTVEDIGSEVHGFNKGDRVFVTSTNYRDNRTSTFQEYVVAFPFNVGRLPEWVSFEEGVTLGVSSVAAAAALFEGLEIQSPRNSSPRFANNDKISPVGASRWILVWGGSCVTGMMVIQLAKLNGFNVFAVAGLQNALYLHSLGADKVVDRCEPENAIAEARKLDIGLGIDCVGQQTATHAIQALQPGGRLVYLVKKPELAVVEASQTEITDIVIKRFHEDPAYGQFLMDYISQCLYSRTIRPVRHEVVQGGLDVVERGLAILKNQRVSGRKLVILVN